MSEKLVVLEKLEKGSVSKRMKSTAANTFKGTGRREEQKDN